MRILAPGVAHVSYLGGGMFMPVRTPYDRQLLMDHIRDRAHSKSRVQVLIDKRRWLVDRFTAPTVHCSCCGERSNSACYDPLDDRSVYCIPCAFGSDDAHLTHGELQRRSA